MCRYFPENAQFWLTLKSDEVGHALHIEKMISAIYARPQAFEIGLPIRKAAIRMIS